MSTIKLNENLVEDFYNEKITVYFDSNRDALEDGVFKELLRNQLIIRFDMPKLPSGSGGYYYITNDSEYRPWDCNFDRVPSGYLEVPFIDFLTKYVEREIPKEGTFLITICNKMYELKSYGN